MSDVREKVRQQIEAAIARGVVLDARVQLDVGASGELFGRTTIRVRDLLEALDVPAPKGAQ